MNRERLKELLEKIPVSLLTFVFLAYLGYQYWDFANSSESPLGQRQSQVEGLKTDQGRLQAKIKQANDFLKGLEAKKAELRKLAQQLDEMKATLNESIDVPQLMKATITEAQKVGLTVLGLKPTVEDKKEFYVEQGFEFAFRGVFVQFVVFLDRLSQWQKIIRVDDYLLKPKNSSSSRYVELEGVLTIKAYKYAGSKADNVGREDGAGRPPVPSPGQPVPTPAGAAGGSEAGGP